MLEIILSWTRFIFYLNICRASRYLSNDGRLSEGEALIRGSWDKITLEFVLEELDGEAAGICQVAEVAHIHELGRVRDLSPGLNDPRPREAHVRHTDPDLPIAAIPTGLVPPCPGPGLY